MRVSFASCVSMVHPPNVMGMVLRIGAMSPNISELQ